MSKYTAAFFRYYFLNLINIQLFVTLISLPIFIAWGIPISLFSIIGNIVFSPFLTAHIFLSSIIFLCAFFGVTCIPLLWLLDKLSIFWLILISYFPETAQIGFARPPAPFLLLLALATLTILHAKQLTQYKKIILYTFLLTSMILCSELYRRLQKSIIDIPCFNGHVQLLTINNKCTLIDQGYMGQRISAPSWAEYTLMPTILKSTGRASIDVIVALKPTIFTLNALEVLCRKRAVHTIYLPIWSGKNEHKLYAAFTAFIQTAAAHQCTVVRFSNNQIIPIVAQGADGSITLSTIDKNSTKNGIIFPKAAVSGIIDNKPFNFYASHHNRQKKSKNSKFYTQ